MAAIVSRAKKRSHRRRKLKLIPDSMLRRQHTRFSCIHIFLEDFTKKN